MALRNYIICSSTDIFISRFSVIFMLFFPPLDFHMFLNIVQVVHNGRFGNLGKLQKNIFSPLLPSALFSFLSFTFHPLIHCFSKWLLPIHPTLYVKLVQLFVVVQSPLPLCPLTLSPSFPPFLLPFSLLFSSSLPLGKHLSV